MSAHALLVFARCIGFVFRAPGFSHPSVPPSLRAGLALVLSIGLVHAGGVAHDTSGVAMVFGFATELGIGAAIGMGASVLYDGAYAAGRALDDYVGVRGSVPNAAVSAASGFGRVWSLVFTAAFFLLDGYRYVIGVFAQTFESLPAGALPTQVSLHAFAVALPLLILKAAVLIAGPAIAIAFVAQFALGGLGRVVPRFQSFTLSFPIVFGAALVVTMLSVPLLYPLGARAWMVLP